MKKCIFYSLDVQHCIYAEARYRSRRFAFTRGRQKKERPSSYTTAVSTQCTCLFQLSTHQKIIFKIYHWCTFRKKIQVHIWLFTKCAALIRQGTVSSTRLQVHSGKNAYEATLLVVGASTLLVVGASTLLVVGASTLLVVGASTLLVVGASTLLVVGASTLLVVGASTLLVVGASTLLVVGASTLLVVGASTLLVVGASTLLVVGAIFRVLT